MAHAPLRPVFAGLRIGLHVIVIGLDLLVIGRALLGPAGRVVPVVVLATALLAVYLLGAPVARIRDARRRRRAVLLWCAVLVAVWVALLWCTPDAAYLVFPLFFLLLHLLGHRGGLAAVVVATAIAVVGLARHDGWTVGGVVGPVVGAAVAVVIGLGYRALAREDAQRAALVQELVATRDQLAVTEHESGVLAERARLAREIHDTLAQGLSSIQLLLHAAERADPDGPGTEHVRLARRTAAENLAEARRFIRELTPPDLDDRGLGGALRRLAAAQWETAGLVVDVQVTDDPELPMPVQSALLRIAQGAVANVLQHASASRATITLTTAGDHVRFTVTDDGTGFDPAAAAGTAGRTDAFGLQATRERVDQLGGVLTVASAPGAGTTIAVDLTLRGAA